MFPLYTPLVLIPSYSRAVKVVTANSLAHQEWLTQMTQELRLWVKKKTTALVKLNQIKDLLCEQNSIQGKETQQCQVYTLGYF